jgi:serine protease inhibitor
MKKYVIITSDDVSSVDFSQVQETSIDTLRWNNDKTKTFVKYVGDKPSFLNGKTEHTVDELLAILDVVDGEWWRDME